MFRERWWSIRRTKANNMIQQRSISLLSSAERHLLRQNRRQTGQQYLRYFHSSKPTLAEESKGNDKGTPYNAPNRGPNRQERAAKASSEVSALASDLPKANLNGRNAEVEGAQPRSPGVSPQAQGKDVGPGSMGENDSPRQEGPLSQGAGGIASGTVEDAGSPKQALKSNSNTKTPTTAPAPKNTKPSKQTVSTKSRKASPTAEDYLSQAPGISTLLGSGAPGMIMDRSALLSPRSTPSTPSYVETAYRLRHHPKQITAFRSRAEKDAYTKPLRDLRAQQAKLWQEAKKAKEENGAVPAPLKSEIVKLRDQIRKLAEFRPLPESVQQGIINRMVLGKYDEQGLLSGKQVHRQPQLNVVAQELLKNSTYLAKDSEKLMNKLRGLLPAAAATAAKKAPAAKAKA